MQHGLTPSVVPTLSMVPRAAWAHVEYDATYSMGPGQAWYLLLTTYHAGQLPLLRALSGMPVFPYFLQIDLS